MLGLDSKFSWVITLLIFLINLAYILISLWNIPGIFKGFFVIVTSDFSFPPPPNSCFFIVSCKFYSGAYFLPIHSSFDLITIKMNLVSHSVMSDSLQSHGWGPTRLLYPWNSPGKNKGVGFIQFSRSVVSDSLRPHELQHARPRCPSPTPRVHSDSRPSSLWCHPAISSSVVPFSSGSQSLPASDSFPMSQLFAWGGQSTGLSALASFLPKKFQCWSPSEWIGWISLQSKGLWRVFSNTTVQKHQFFSAHISSQSNSHIHTWLLEKP